MVYFGKVSDGCATILGVVYFIRELLNIVLFLIPIALIVMLSIDFLKGVISFDDGNKKVINFVVKRIIYTVVIFLIPSVVFGLFSVLGVNIGDSNSCWKYVGETNVQEVKEISEAKEKALEDKEKEFQDELSDNLKKENAIASSVNKAKTSTKKKNSGTTSSKKKCSKKTKIRLTSFKGSNLRNSIKKSKVGTTNKNFKTYTYKGKKYLVVATAMKKTSWQNPVSSYNFKDYDTLTLQIEGKIYDAIVLDVCGACASSTKKLKIDLWTTDNKQWWKDNQYICTG